MKTLKDAEQLISYIRDWSAIDGLKPKNEEIFISEFIKLISAYPDDREVEFDGEGSYFGKQVTLRPFSMYCNPPIELRFEVSYSSDKISVYSANHAGFWYPEYLQMDRTMPGFIHLRLTLFNFLKGVFGL